MAKSEVLNSALLLSMSNERDAVMLKIDNENKSLLDSKEKAKRACNRKR